MLTKTIGNLFTLAEAGSFDIVVHGCNCWHTFGSGCAREVRLRYPTVYEADRRTSYGDKTKLGTYSFAIVGDFIIINAYTQYNMSTGEDVFEYTAFGLILQKLAHRYPTARFGFPFIGMGLAKGNKAMIMAMLEDFAATIDKTGGSVTLVEYAV